MCPKGDGGAKKDVDQLSKEVPEQYKKNGKCDQYADAMEQKMKEAGVEGERIRVNSDHNIYSDKAGEVIGSNGYHDAVKVGDTVYDNMNPGGMPFNEWLKDLGIGEVSGIDWSVVKLIN